MCISTVVESLGMPMEMLRDRQQVVTEIMDSYSDL
jgi:hypothetical protein